MSELVAVSTAQTYLMVKKTTAGEFEKVIDIKDYPDMVGEPNKLDATTLSHLQEIQIDGILRAGNDRTFTANYTPANYKTVKDLEGHQYQYALWLGGTAAGVPDGHLGKFTWTGDVRAGFPGKGVDEVADMTVSVTPSTDVEWEGPEAE